MGNYKLLFIPLALAWLAGTTWIYSKSNCCNCSVVSANVNNQAVATPAIAANQTELDKEDIVFGLHSGIPLLAPAGDNLLSGYYQQYAIAAGRRLFTITGYYNEEEKNNSSFKNLGLFRAEEVKKLLVAKGVRPSDIFTSGQLALLPLKKINDTIIRGIIIVMGPGAPAKNDLFASRVVYFETAKNNFILSAGLEKYLQEAKQYMRLHPDKKLHCIGYTDNVGTDVANKSLSLQRAVFIKTQLYKAGLADVQVIVEGKGAANPAADNHTDNGRAKNRRVEISLQ